MRTWNYNNVIRWIRKSHGWVGLWGALLGLIFGFSGIWLNHRTVLKLPVTQTRSNAQLALPDPAPANAEDMRAWLQASLNITGSANSSRVDAAKPVAWADKKASLQPPLIQPEHWFLILVGRTRSFRPTIGLAIGRWASPPPQMAFWPRLTTCTRARACLCRGFCWSIR